MRQSGRTAIGLWMLGILLVQSAWMVAVPPFRGMDEPDHAFRAAGVAAGQWRLTDVVAQGRGEAVFVPPALVAAAKDQCTALEYKLEFDCSPFAERGDGLVGVATGAGSYNPAYYAVVGWVGKPFDGASSLYAMRIASAVWCALFLLGGLVALRVRRPRKVVWVAAAAAVTPTLLYSTVVVAPNGVEMAAGFCLWGALLALAPDDVGAGARNRWLLALAAFAGVVLVSVRTLGPLWAFLIILCMAVAHGRTAIAHLLVRHKVAVAVASATVIAATVSALVWSGTAGLLANPDESLDSSSATAAPLEPLGGTVYDVHGWVFQAVAAFPFRNQPAPLIVYPLVLIVVMTILIAALLRTQGKSRVSLLLAITLAIAVPVALVAATSEGQGAGWQGRYVLPFMVGILPLAASLMSARATPGFIGLGTVQIAAAAMVVLAHIVAVADLQQRELGREVSAQDAAWIHPATWATAAVMLAGWCLLAWSVRHAQSSEETVV